MKLVRTGGQNMGRRGYNRHVAAPQMKRVSFQLQVYPYGVAAALTPTRDPRGQTAEMRDAGGGHDLQ